MNESKLSHIPQYTCSHAPLIGISWEIHYADGGHHSFGRQHALPAADLEQN